MKNILMVFGTRPEAIKMAPLYNELKNNINDFKTFLCVTGQHREMLDQVLSTFSIRPDFDLNLMKPGQELNYLFSEVLDEVTKLIDLTNPDIVLVHGDTVTSTAASMAAYFKHVKIGHVEAGLRTNDIYSPFPEEMNRQITARMASYHFAPTLNAVNNLIKENIESNKIFLTGNTIIDALNQIKNILNSNSQITNSVDMSLRLAGYDMARKDLNKRIVLITGHRRESFGLGIQNICNSIKNLAKKFPEIDFVYPVHPNPNVQKPVNNLLANSNDNVFLIKPLDYLPFIYLLINSFIVMTDSGGIQEEAPCLNKPVLVMRDNTERLEVIETGSAILVGTNKEAIIDNISLLINNPSNYEKMAFAPNPYGEGGASKMIVKYLKSI